MAPSFLLLHVITNEKILKLKQIDRLPALPRFSPQKHVPTTLVGIPVDIYTLGGVTLPILKVGRPFAVKREFRTVSKVPGSSQFLTVAISTLITALETLLFSKIGIDWIGIVMSGPPFAITSVIDEKWPRLLLCANTWEYE